MSNLDWELKLSNRGLKLCDTKLKRPWPQRLWSSSCHGSLEFRGLKIFSGHDHNERHNLKNLTSMAIASSNWAAMAMSSSVYGIYKLEHPWLPQARAWAETMTAVMDPYLFSNFVFAYVVWCDAYLVSHNWKIMANIQLLERIWLLVKFYK